MRFSQRSCLLAAFALMLSFGSPAAAHSFKLGSITIDHPAAPASLPGQASAVVHLTIENMGTKADRLIKLASPIAENVMIHHMTTSGSIMKMREIDSLSIQPSAKIAMTRGNAYHVMMTGIKHPLVSGDRVPLVLTFEHAGALEVVINVERSAAEKASGAESNSGAHQH